MLALYENAEMKMLSKFSSRLYKGTKQAKWEQKKYAEMKEVRRDCSKALSDLRERRKRMAEEFVTTAYSAGSNALYADAKQAVASMGISEMISPNATKVAAILLDLNNTLDAADRVILRQTNDVYARIVGNAAALVATGTMTVREAVKK